MAKPPSKRSNHLRNTKPNAAQAMAAGSSRSRRSPKAASGPTRKHSGHGRREKARPTVPAAKRKATTPPPLPPLPFRIGHGYDLHRLEPRVVDGGHDQSDQGDLVGSAKSGRSVRPLIVGGIELDETWPMGPVAHSDGDVLYHAITDALLGALCLPDIGQLFPDNDPANNNRNSARFVKAAVAKVLAAGYSIGNLDCTVILERPKISPHKIAIRENIAKLLKISVEQVNLKGKTHERVDAVGEGRAIEAHVVVLLIKRAP